MGFSSQAGHIILRTQPVRGTYATDIDTAGVGAKLRTGSLGPTRTLLVPDPEIGGGRDVVDAYLGAGAFSGDYEFYARMEMICTLLQAALGTAVSAPSGTGANTHTITPSDSAQLPFLSIEEELGAGLEIYNYTDGVVNTLHLEAEANGYLMGTAGVIAVKQTAGNTATTDPEWDDTPMIVGTNILVTYNGITLPAKSFGLDINNNYEDDDFRLGSFYLNQLTPKRREITATFRIRPEDSDLWRQAVYGTTTATEMAGLTTKSALVIDAKTYEDIAGSTPTLKYGIHINFSKYILNPYALPASGDDLIENDVEGRAVRPQAGTPIATVVVTNGSAAIA